MPATPRPISALTDRELTTLLDNYEARGCTVGGPYTAAECHREKARRASASVTTLDPTNWVTEEVRAEIIRQVRANRGPTTYGAVHKAREGGKKWTGNRLQQNVGTKMADVLYLCLNKGHDPVNLLVVNAKTRALSDGASSHILRMLVAEGRLPPGADVADLQVMQAKVLAEVLAGRIF